MNANVHTDSFSITSKKIGRTCSRVIITLYSVIPTDEFSTMIGCFERLFNAAEANDASYCVLFHIHNEATLHPLQMGSLVMTLTKYRHVTQKHSITTAIVASSKVSGILNLIVSMYKPVGHVEVTDDLRAAKDHCKIKVRAHESIDDDGGGKVEVDQRGSGLPK